MQFKRNKALDPTLLTRAREMRGELSAPAEQRVWQFLRDRQLGGYKFRRQHPIGPYVADFYCHECSLIVELDGASHVERVEHDAHRDAYLREHGHHVVRFDNADAFDHLDSVLNAIYEACEERAEHSSKGESTSQRRPSPQPSPGGRGSKTRIDFSRFNFHRVIDLPDKYEVFDFASSAEPFWNMSSPYGIGRYDEKRTIYTTELFRDGGRCVHVGLDIGAPVGTPCRAFYDGSVLYQGYNAAAGDYGHTVITQHVLDGVELFALWGHLSKASIELRKPGDAFRAGDVIGYLGDRHENGRWNPHLHFQLSYERPTTYDLPGVVSEADRARALEIYPNPRLVLGPLY